MWERRFREWPIIVSWRGEMPRSRLSLTLHPSPSDLLRRPRAPERQYIGRQLLLVLAETAPDAAVAGELGGGEVG